MYIETVQRLKQSENQMHIKHQIHKKKKKKMHRLKQSEDQMHIN